jgi:hypothetical protein
LRRAFVSAFAVLAGIFAAAPLHAADAARVDQPAFVFALPPPWEPLSKDGPKNLENYNFYNMSGDVVQLGVSKPLATKAYAAARKSARADSQESGWKLVRSRVVKMPALGDVDENVYVDPEQPLSLYSYSVFGPGRIASIRIMYNRRDVSASESARKIVRGLRWKKAAKQPPPR